jgi:hypothetical protein
METLTIKIRDSKALKLIQDLESLNLIQVIKTSSSKKSSQKLSEMMTGSISQDQTDLMHEELKKIAVTGTGILIRHQFSN